MGGGEGAYGKSVYFLLSGVVNLKLLYEIQSINFLKS